MKSPVSLVRCTSYDSEDLDRSIAAAIELAGGFDPRGAIVLLKPNLLNANGHERAVTVHPALIAAMVRWLKAAGATRVLVGDSPGWQPQDFVGRKTGAMDAAIAAGGEWADFSAEAEFELPTGKMARRFRLARPLAEADLLVDLPKLKTHQLMYFTGAVKNLFGLVPGLQKSAFHLRFPERGAFAAMLADLALAALPDFSLMDAVVAMEGPGPNNGKPRELGLIMASRDPLALDWTAADLIGYDPATIPYLAELLKRMAESEAAREGRSAKDRQSPAWIGRADAIEVRGLALDEARPASFALVPILKENDFFHARMPAWLHRLVRDCTVPRPRFDHGKCLRCSGCVRICPAKALSLVPPREGGSGRVEIDYPKCIRCYCCHEICPEDAIELVRGPFPGPRPSR